VPIWLEKFALAILATAFVGLVILNTLKLDATQRWSLGVAVLAMSVFVAQTLHLYKAKNESTQPVVGTSTQEKMAPEAAPPSAMPRNSPPSVHQPVASSMAKTSHPPAIIQHGQNNIAQIGNNNQATINADLPSRLLTSEQMQEFARDISKIPPQDFFLAIETNDRDEGSEQMLVYKQLGEILKAAKWRHLVEEINSGKLNRMIPLQYIYNVSQRGIIIAAPDKLMPQAEELGKEMDKFHLHHSFRRFNMMGGDNNIPVDFIFIKIGIQ
jgi:hypothetical protein